MDNLGIADDVLSVTFSEFGRKATENGNLGTDHGTLAPMYVLGKNVNPGVLGQNLNISDLDSTGAPNVEQIQHDYRQVFGTLMQDWLGGDDNSLQAAKLKDYTTNKVAIIAANKVVDPNCYAGQEYEDPGAFLKIKLNLEGFFDNDTKAMKSSLAQCPPCSLLTWHHGTITVQKKKQLLV